MRYPGSTASGCLYTPDMSRSSRDLVEVRGPVGPTEYSVGLRRQLIHHVNCNISIALDADHRLRGKGSRGRESGGDREKRAGAWVGRRCCRVSPCQKTRHKASPSCSYKDTQGILLPQKPPAAPCPFIKSHRLQNTLCTILLFRFFIYLKTLSFLGFFGWFVCF